MVLVFGFQSRFLGRATLLLQQTQTQLLGLIGKLEVDAKVRPHMCSLERDPAWDGTQWRIRRAHAAVRQAYPTADTKARTVTSAPRVDQRTSARNKYAKALSDLYGAEQAVSESRTYPVNLTVALAEVERYVLSGHGCACANSPLANPVYHES